MGRDKRFNEVTLSVGVDTIQWSLTKYEVFSVSSLCGKLILNDIGYPHEMKVILWLVQRNSILTQDNF
jgi:hypothetical protein